MWTLSMYIHQIHGSCTNSTPSMHDIVLYVNIYYNAGMTYGKRATPVFDVLYPLCNIHEFLYC